VEQAVSLHLEQLVAVLRLRDAPLEVDQLATS